MANQPITSDPSMPEPGGQPGGLAKALLPGLGAYLGTSLVVVLGVAFGHTFVPLAPVPQARRGDLLSAFTNWDGQWYTIIVNEGYHYHPGVHSTVAFFPAYPLLSRGAAEVFGLSTTLALLLVSQFCLAAAFVVLAAWLRERCRDAPPGVADFTLVAFGLFPTTMFFRMAYSEALFVLVLALFLYGIQRRWPLATLALLVGLGTACRAPGVALLPPLVLHVWQVSSSLRQRATRLCLLVPLACWGLLGYALYQGAAFGEPWAFVKTQAAWRLRPPAPSDDKWRALLSYAPIWSAYNPSSPAYWARLDPNIPALFSLWFANPLYFLFAGAVTALGWLKGWLRESEVILAVSLLVIPYAASSYEMHMAGCARFAAVVLPVYLVLGRLLCRASVALATSLLALCAFMLGTYAALFASWHRFF